MYSFRQISIGTKFISFVILLGCMLYVLSGKNCNSNKTENTNTGESAVSRQSK